jgi:diguanylate cyclase (GGDEF)-like protein
MQIQRSKFHESQGKKADFLNPGSKPSSVSSLTTQGNSQTSYSGISGIRLRKDSEAVDVVFQALLSDANEELARLLQDVHADSQALPSGDIQKRSVSELLMRAVRCAAKQYMLQAELGNLALTDDLTNLYNRRGFQALAERQLKLARRSERAMLLFFIDVNGLKRINDSFGHCEGDLTLKRTATILKNTFRDSDIIARLGGDEFAVLAVQASDRNENSIRARLHRCLNAVNAQEPRFQLSISIGVARFDHRYPTSIRDLMAQADEAMYEQKRNRPAPRMLTAEECPS